MSSTRRLLVMLTVLATCLPVSAVAQESSGSHEKDERALAAEQQRKLAKAEDTSVTDFKGMGFGVGIGFSKDLGRGRIVQQAQVINGIVRVTEGRSDIPRLVLETHYFWVPERNDRLGIGPFVAVQTGSSDVIDAIGAGVMFGMRRTTIETKVTKDSAGALNEGTSEVKTDSFNVGIACMLDSQASVLRDGVVENQAIASGEEGSPLTRKESRWGLAFLFSFTF